MFFKWVGVLVAPVLGLVGLILGLLGIEPGWWGAVAGGIITFVQRIAAGAGPAPAK